MKEFLFTILVPITALLFAMIILFEIARKSHDDRDDFDKNIFE